ncbi:hypothetical protein QVE09_19420 [Paenibacillus sp. ClWae2A]|uniref:hypothetical protein n=1 Tax=Paenibacillus sp. ClWae2A TaxID=3057177 RepID=UPI0028F57347|nr:hypothetical protein [Paenibacillus sp. ClWae2A]MDT9721076.1 hypothetical protein [Paenibacillus sp. ClWae2A]
MNLIKKIEEGQCSIDELQLLLNEANPIVLYHVMTYIGKEKLGSTGINEKLEELTSRRGASDKLIGYYKVGDLAIATLIKLDKKTDEIAIFKSMDDFDKKMIFNLIEELEW